MADLPITTNLDFSEFQSIDLNQWMERIQLDLKGKNWEDFQWEIEPGLSFDPAQFDTSKTYQPLFSKRDYSWIGHEVEVEKNLEASNMALLDLLMMGISAPKLIIAENLSKDDWENLFHNVSLEFLKVHLVFSNETTANVGLKTLSEAKLNLGEKPLSGTVDLVDGKNELSFLQAFGSAFPKMNFLPIVNQGDSSIKELAGLLKAVHHAIQKGLDNNIAINKIFENILVQLSIGNSFLLEVAKLRAARLLFNLLSESYELKKSEFEILVVAKNEAFSGEAELDVIRMTAMTLAANLGGADQIMLPNLDNDRKSFLQRITANIQHILNLESHLGKVGDPLAGSHYLEALTEQIAEKAWAEFQQRC